MSNIDASGDSAERAGHSGGWSDRVLGLVAIAGAVAYVIQARTYDGTGFGSGPVGPKTLPTGLGVFTALCGAYIFVRPDRPPTWPSRSATWQIGVILAASYLYGRILKDVGFIVASTLMIVLMAALFRAPWRRLLPLAIVFPIIVAYIFNNWLELILPDGLWGGF